MRALAALVVSLALIAPAPAEADSQIGTRTYLVAAQKGGLVAFRVERVEERPHGHYVPASGYVSLEVKVPGHAWQPIPKSRKLAYKGRAMYFYRASSKPGSVRAISAGAPGYARSVSRPVTFPLH